MIKFKTLTDISHAAVGFVVGLGIIHSILFPAAVAAIGFAVYQILDYVRGEDQKETIGDCKEFLSGFTAAFIIYLAQQLGVVIV